MRLIDFGLQFANDGIAGTPLSTTTTRTRPLKCLQPPTFNDYPDVESFDLSGMRLNVNSDALKSE